MNKRFKEIATKYEMAEEISNQILAGLKIKNGNRTPSTLQLEGFESVCGLLKEGVDLASAIAQVEESWQQPFSEVNLEAETETKEKAPSWSSSPNKNGQVKTSETVSAEFNNINIDSIVERQVEEATNQALASLPQLSEAEYNRFKESFVKKFRQQLAKKLLRSNFSQNFAKYVNAQVEEHEQGKLKYIESIQTPLAYSPENSALPPGK